MGVVWMRAVFRKKADYPESHGHSDLSLSSQAPFTHKFLVMPQPQ